MHPDDIALVRGLIASPAAPLYGIWIYPSNRWMGMPASNPVVGLDPVALDALIPWADLDTSLRPEVYRVAQIPDDWGVPTVFITPRAPVNPPLQDGPGPAPMEPGAAPAQLDDPIYDWSLGVTPPVLPPRPDGNPEGNPNRVFQGQDEPDPNRDPVTGNPIVWPPPQPPPDPPPA